MPNIIYNQNQIEIIKKIYYEGLDYYKSNTKPYNYILHYVIKYSQINLNKQELYNIIYDVDMCNMMCPVCKNNYRKFSSLAKGYNKTCSNKCSRDSHEYKQKMQEIIHKPRKTKGKSYLEIYGASTPSCGFKKGDENIAKRIDIRKKISEGVTKSYTPELLQKRRDAKLKYIEEHGINNFNKRYVSKDGNLYRSNFEVQIADILFTNNIKYEYEKIVKLYDNRIKIVDFVIDNNKYLEVTGYAYDSWQKDFNNKICKLNNTLDMDNNHIIIITYSDKLDLLYENLYKEKMYHNVYYGTFDKLLNIINLTRGIDLFNNNFT